MWYEITGVNLEYRKSDAGEVLFPGKLTVTIVFENGQEKTVTPDMNAADMRQLENLLRRRIDKVLNG